MEDIQTQLQILQIHVDEEERIAQDFVQDSTDIAQPCIDHVAFRLLSEQDIQKLSVLNVLYPNPFVHGKIKEYGLHDLRLGATTQFDPCRTCREGIETCNGHYGHISLAYPIYHALFFKNLVKILNCLCFACFNLVIDIHQTSLLAQELKTKTRSNRQLRKDQFDSALIDLSSSSTLDFLYNQSKYKLRCEQCGFPKHRIELRKLDLKIVWKQTKQTPKRTETKEIFTNPVDQQYATQLTTHLDAGFILFCLRQLPLSTRQWLLGPLDPTCFLWMNVLVPPSITRPYTSQGKRVGLNELTVKLNEIVISNLTLFNQTDPTWYRFTQRLLNAEFDCTQFPPEWIWMETWCQHQDYPDELTNKICEYACDQSWWQASNHTRALSIRLYVEFWMHMRSRVVNQKWIEQYALLKYHGSVFLDNGLRMHKPEKKTVRANAFAKGIAQRIKGKYGRFRWNLLGKRGDQCARTVVVPEAFLDIDELRVPSFVAKTLTISDIVQGNNSLFQLNNRAKLQQLVVRGAHHWPGANSVIKRGNDNQTKTIELELLSSMERKALANDLQNGDQVLRHLQDGDICLFNRQPSLHRSSMMGHRVRVVNHEVQSEPQSKKTKRLSSTDRSTDLKGFGLHECVTHTYNADFDGDEMNFFAPQTFEARAEIREFMMVEDQMFNHQNLGLAFGMKQNPLLVLSLLSSLDYWFTREEAMQYAMIFQSGSKAWDFPEPAIQKPVCFWLGRQLVSLAFPSDFCYSRINVVISQGEWITGELNKKHLGAGEGQLFHVLLHQMGSKVTKRVFSDLHHFTSEWLLHNGVSCGVSDCVEDRLSAGTIRDTMVSVVNDTIRQTEHLANESKTIHFLNTLLSFTQPQTRPENRLLAMVSSGSKGSPTNLIQIMCMLGQQNIDGKRMQKPFFPTLSEERTPKLSGLVTHSYFEGLDSVEFYTHCAAGRKGLVDTAVATAGTGYQQRRLIKILESIFVGVDGTVRTTDQQIVNTSYGLCNLDIRHLQPYRLKTKLEWMPELYEALQETQLNLALRQQIFLGQNVTQSKSPHVHESALKQEPIQIEIPFSIDYVWKKFIEQHPVDLNPQDASNLRNVFDSWTHRQDSYGIVQDNSNKHFLLKVLIVDWFSQPSDQNGSNNPNMPMYIYRDDFVEFLKILYDSKFVSSGEAVGASAAESIAEPATQMTLNTFHHTGIHQQNVTNGIPRLRELFSVQETIKTPMIYACLLEPPARTNGRYPPMFLETLATSIVQHPIQYFLRDVSLVDTSIAIEFHHERLRQYKLTPFVLAKYIETQMHDFTLKIRKKSVAVTVQLEFTCKPKHHQASGLHQPTGLMLKIHPQPFISETIQYVFQAIKTDWIVSGVVGVESAHIYCTKPTSSSSIMDIDKETNFMSVLGSDKMCLKDVWDIYPIDYRQTFSNNIVEIQRVLGIDATKYVLFKEMKAAMSLEGSMVHDTHIRLLVDVMTCTGKLLPTDRNGLEQFAPDNILTRASFEKNMDVLREAAMNYKQQAMTGISESIMVGSDLALGTGTSKMIPIEPKTADILENARTFVSTQDWNDETFNDFSSDSWAPYIELILSIEQNCTDVCLQFVQKVQEHIAQQEHTSIPTTQSQAPIETYLSRKRKQNEVLVHVDYRPSSPFLSEPFSETQTSENNDIGAASVEMSDNKDSSSIEKGRSVESKAPSQLVTRSEVSELVRSLNAVKQSKEFEAFGLIQSLLSKSLMHAFSCGESFSSSCPSDSDHSDPGSCSVSSSFSCDVIRYK